MSLGHTSTFNTDMEFEDLQYDNYADSPFDASQFIDLSAADNIDSPNFGSHDLSRTTHDNQDQTLHSRSLVSSRSAASSSQDSSSEASVRRKRKTTSESESPPITEKMDKLKVEQGAIKPEDMMDANNFQMQNFDGSMGFEQDFMSNTAMNNHFDFGDSVNSSPSGTGVGGYDRTPMSHGGAPVCSLPLCRGRHKRICTDAIQAGTIEPQFFLGSSNGSPVSVKGKSANSPSTMFSQVAPTSGAPEMFSNNQMWAGQGQNPAWGNEYSAGFTSPGALGLTPSPVPHESSAQFTTLPEDEDRIPLHIGPIPSKSRVETQISIL